MPKYVEDFETAKKNLDKKFRERKRGLYNYESNRIEIDRSEHEIQYAELKKLGELESLNEAKRLYSELQKRKDSEFEQTIFLLKSNYKAELNEICESFNVGFNENFMESGLSLAGVSREQSDHQLGNNRVNLSASKFNEISRWAADTSQSIEANNIDSTTELDEADVVVSPRRNWEMELKAVDVLKRKSSSLQSPSSISSSSRRRLISGSVGSDKMHEFTSRSDLNESRVSSKFIKKQPISGITRIDGNQLQFYYNSATAPPAATMKDVKYLYKSQNIDHFQRWLDSLNNVGNSSLPKVPLPPADNFVERIDLPIYDDHENSVNGPLPDAVIKSLLDRLAPGSKVSEKDNNSKEDIVGEHKDQHNSGKNDGCYRKNKNEPLEDAQADKNRLKKWKSAPFDLNENESLQHASGQIKEADTEELAWLSSLQYNLRSPVPVDYINTRSQNSSRMYKKLPPVPNVEAEVIGEHYNNISVAPEHPDVFDLHDISFVSLRSPPKVPPRESTSVFQEIPVDKSGKKRSIWGPILKPDDNVVATPRWNARAMDRNTEMHLGRLTLTRRFQLFRLNEIAKKAPIKNCFRISKSSTGIFFFLQSQSFLFSCVHYFRNCKLTNFFES